MFPRSVVKNILESDVLFTSEAAELLEVTPQAINNMVYRQKLTPIRVSAGANLFYKQDILDIKNNRTALPITRPTAIYGDGITRRCLSHIYSLPKSVTDEIVGISIYEFGYDAAVDGYTTPTEPCFQNSDQLVSARTPHTVFTLASGEELWYKGLTCGYPGEGPSGTQDVLTNIFGMPASLTDYVKDCSVIKYNKHDDEWFLAESLVPDKEMVQCPHFYYYYYNGNRVLTLAISRYDRIVDWTYYLPYLLPFLPNPSHISILTEDEAVATGRIESTTTGRTRYYQVIIHDRCGTEIWLDLPVSDDIKISKQTNVINLFRALDMPLPEEGRQELSVVLKRWINRNLPVRRKDRILGLPQEWDH